MRHPPYLKQIKNIRRMQRSQLLIRIITRNSKDTSIKALLKLVLVNTTDTLRDRYNNGHYY